MTVYNEQEAKRIIGLYIQEYSGDSTDLEDAVNSLIELKCKEQRENDITSLVNTQYGQQGNNDLYLCGITDNQFESIQQLILNSPLPKF